MSIRGSTASAFFGRESLRPFAGRQADRADRQGHWCGHDAGHDFQRPRHAVKAGLDYVEFCLGEIENLPVADRTADLILSNCVINLSPDKPRAYAEAFRVLQPGGRMAVSDIVSLQPVPEALKADFTAYTGCIGGAVSAEAMRQMLAAVGFTEIRVEVNETSREFINEWLPGARAGDYVASANITARRRKQRGHMGKR